MRYLSCLFLLLSGLVIGQNTPKTGAVEILEDSLITTAFQLKIEANKERYSDYNFTIQLFNGTYNEAQKVMESLENIAEDLEPELTFETPNYKVQVGPFKKLSEAKGRLQELKKHYRGAFLLEPKTR